MTVLSPPARVRNRRADRIRSPKHRAGDRSIRMKAARSRAVSRRHARLLMWAFGDALEHRRLPLGAGARRLTPGAGLDRSNGTALLS
jgi:hypothetical protein